MLRLVKESVGGGVGSVGKSRVLQSMKQNPFKQTGISLSNDTPVPSCVSYLLSVGLVSH